MEEKQTTIDLQVLNEKKWEVRLMENNTKVPFILEFTPESMIQSLKEDPRVISAKFENGTFYVECAEGSFSFELKHRTKGVGNA